MCNELYYENWDKPPIVKVFIQDNSWIVRYYEQDNNNFRRGPRSTFEEILVHKDDHFNLFRGQKKSISIIRREKIE